MTAHEGKLLGIDYGSKQVGFAISDQAQSVAFPKDVCPTDTALEYVINVCKQENIAGIVLGESTDFDGEENPVMKEIKEFKASLEEELDIPIYFEPEYLSTKQASRQQEARDDLDAAAAAIILRSFLASQNNTT